MNARKWGHCEGQIDPKEVFADAGQQFSVLDCELRESGPDDLNSAACLPTSGCGSRTAAQLDLDRVSPPIHRVLATLASEEDYLPAYCDAGNCRDLPSNLSHQAQHYYCFVAKE